MYTDQDTGYFLPKIKLKIYNFMIDWRNFFHQTVTRFSPMSHFYTARKPMSENLCFSGVFRGYRNVTLD